MIPFSVRVPVQSAVVFPAGALWVGCDAATDFDRRGEADDQARDPVTGDRIWVVTVMDLEEPEEGRFRPSVELKVKVMGARPERPASRVPGYPPVVAFEGLTLTPWVDSQRCVPGHPGLCRARLSYSLRAVSVVEFDGVAA